MNAHDGPIIEHDGACEWYDCRACGYHCDPANERYNVDSPLCKPDEAARVAASLCPKCGSSDVGMRA